MISTKDIPQSGGGIPKVIQPGNRNAKVNSIVLEPYTYKAGSLHLILNLETAPIEGFVGFNIVKDNDSNGTYKGQFGKVSSDQWAYSDGVTKGGRKVSRDIEIMKFLQDFCKNLGIMDWFNAQDNKHETIESFVSALNKERPFKDVYLNWCIAGKEYEGKGGYKNYNLFLPKYVKNEVSFESEDVKESESKLTKFNESLHIIRSKPKVVESFGTTASGDDFEM